MAVPGISSGVRSASQLPWRMAATHVEERRRLLLGVGHPLAVLAAALVLLNDLVLPGRAPTWLTGKLSDIGWLVLAPIGLAATLALLGATRPRSLALGLSAAFFITLQLWPPLGHWFSGRHVADAADLLTLPALLGAVWVWQRPRPGVSPWVGAPLLVGTLAADSYVEPRALTWPCGEDMLWPTTEPLRIQMDDGVGSRPVYTEAFVRSFHLHEVDGPDLPLVATEADRLYLLCARDGLQPGTTYVWELPELDTNESNQAVWYRAAYPTVRFETSADPGRAVNGPEDCFSLAHPLTEAATTTCGNPGDTGGSAPDDTADWGETGTPG